MLARSTRHQRAAVPLARARPIAFGKADRRPTTLPSPPRTSRRRAPPARPFTTGRLITPAAADWPTRPNPHRVRQLPTARAASRGFLPWRLADAGRVTNPVASVRPASTSLHRTRLSPPQRSVSADERIANGHLLCFEISRTLELWKRGMPSKRSQRSPRSTAWRCSGCWSGKGQTGCRRGRLPRALPCRPRPCRTTWRTWSAPAYCARGELNGASSMPSTSRERGAC
jgi:hypothetical protein